MIELRKARNYTHWFRKIVFKYNIQSSSVRNEWNQDNNRSSKRLSIKTSRTSSILTNAFSKLICITSVCSHFKKSV